MKCIVCGSLQFKKIPLIHEVSRYTHKAYPLFKCVECGLVRPNPLPYDEKTKLSIYDEPENIKFYHQKKNKIDRKSYDYNYYFKHFKPFLNFVKKYKINGKGLDVGCGAGHLMILLSKLGIKSEGIDITQKLIKSMKKEGYAVYCGELNSKVLKNKKYDLITANQVLEHIIDPEFLVKDINGLLKKEGYVILAVPYVYGLIPNILRTKWYGLGYGQHLNFFSKKSLKILFERNGFEIKEFKVLSVDYAHPKFPRFLNIFSEIIMSILIYFGLGDNLFVVARKMKEVKK